MSEHKHEWRIDYRDGGAWCGLDCPAQLTSAEVGRRLNAHDPLLAACKEAAAELAPSGEPSAQWPMKRRLLATIAKAEGTL